MGVVIFLMVISGVPSALSVAYFVRRLNSSEQFRWTGGRIALLLIAVLSVGTFFQAATVGLSLFAS